MKRRSFLKKSLKTAGVVPVIGASFPAIAKNRYEWRMVTSWPKGLPGLGTGAERLAETITKLSGGRLIIKVYSAGELVPALGVFDAVADGTAQMGHDASYYHLGKTEGSAFFTSFPWGLTANEIQAWVKYGNGQKLWDELYKPFGIRGFLAGNTGTQMLGWFTLCTCEDAGWGMARGREMMIEKVPMARKGPWPQPHQQKNLRNQQSARK